MVDPQFPLIHMHAGRLTTLQCSLKSVHTSPFIPLRAPLICRDSSVGSCQESLVGSLAGHLAYREVLHIKHGAISSSVEILLLVTMTITSRCVNPNTCINCAAKVLE